MKKYLLQVALVLTTFSSFSQITGDYRSAGTGNWNVPGSWQIYNGAVWIGASFAPSSTDGVITIQSPHIITANTTITADQIIVASGSTLDKSASTFTIANGVGNDMTINGNLIINSNLSGPGNLVVNGTADWNSGTISCSTTISAGNTINGNQGAKVLGATLTNNGTINLPGDGIYNAGGTLINNGIINKTLVSASQADINITWSNAGTINIVAGVLSNTGTFTNTGTINVSSGAVFNNSTSFTYDGGSIAGTGSFNQTGGSLLLNAALTVPASITFNYSGGSTSGAGILTATNLAFSGGNIGGIGGLVLNGTTTWTGGTLSRTFALAAGNTINGNQGAKVLGATLTNNGTINLPGDGIYNGGGTLINNGIINKTLVSATQADINVPITNNTSGIIKGIGTLNFTNTFTNNGTIAPGNSTGLLTVDGTQPFSTSSTLAIQILNTTGVGTGHDQMARSGNLTLNGTLNVTELAVIPLSSFTIINLTSGIITGNFTTINLPFGYSITVGSTTVILNKVTTLPLNLISFGGRKLNSTVLLDWTTDNEVNTSHFVIERSVDGRNYTAIGNISSNNLSTRNQYQYRDQLPSSTTNYYRLKQVDINNSYTYTRIVKIDFRKSITVSVSPNPAKDMMLIEGAENFEEAHIINLQGVILKKMKVVANLRLNVSDLRAGQYFIRLIGKAQEETISFLKQ
ncbi:MAG: T9SS type A sorting domain-containing protein [Ferruginibacter sp.]|nr:T9SS type A sorting domain-containing protein [Ferruginibacter sp.]